MSNALLIICLFTFLIHFTESSVYSMRLAGIRTKQIAISLSFVTSALLVSRLSNMGQAPLLGLMVDSTITMASPTALQLLESQFRLVIFAAFIGSSFGAFLTPTFVALLQKAIFRFLENGSFIGTALSAFHPKNTLNIIRSFRIPSLQTFKDISFSRLPKTFLFMNILVTSIYTIGVLCALLAGAYLPDLRSTAIQLSGIVNGIATILLAIVVDPTGARITDQAAHGSRPESDVKSVVFFLLFGRIIGTLLVAQLIFMPFTDYIILATKWIAAYF